MFRAFPYPYSSKMYSYFMIYYQSVAYKLKIAPFFIDRIQQVHILAHTKDTPEAQTPSQLSRHNKTPIRGIYYELIYLNNYIYTQQNVSKCGGIGHKYVSEYVSKKALPDYHREGFFYPSINHPAKSPNRNTSTASGPNSPLYKGRCTPDNESSFRITAPGSAPCLSLQSHVSRDSTVAG